MRVGFALFLVVLAVAGAATARIIGSGNPTGQWATPAAVEARLLSRGVSFGECINGACRITSSGKLVDRAVTGGATSVVYATVSGIGPFKLVNGVRRYQLFDVRACILYYYKGAHRFRVHFRWFTRRPPGGTTTMIDRNGNPAVGKDDGKPYATDWMFPRQAPLARGHC